MSSGTTQPDTIRRALLGAALFALAAAAAGAFEPKSLEAPALCEASAALPAPWDESLVLIADNERDDQLYVFTIDSGKLVAKEVSQMPAKPRPNDIEALARLGPEVVVV